MSAITVKPPFIALAHLFLHRAFLGKFVLFLIFISAQVASAQSLSIELSVLSVQPARLGIKIQFPEPIEVVSFPNAYADVFGLADRIAEVRAADGDIFKKLAAGEFKSSDSVSTILYEVDLARPVPPNQQSHVSSLNSEHGVLMLADLLPRSLKGHGSFSSATITVNAPARWSVVANEARRETGTFVSDDLQNTVFLVAPHVAEKHKEAGGRSFQAMAAGEWAVSAKDVATIGSRIFQEYGRLTSFPLHRDSVLLLIPYAGNVGPQLWTAETRGNCVVLFLGNRGNAKQTKSRLSVVLAHELFHLWVPNSLALTGDYDWFFEGFTVYQALRTDLRLKFITFDQYLNTIAAVYDSYRSSPQYDQVSLAAASEQRWTTSSALVYNKAALVAFLYELQLANQTGCAKSINDVYRTLFRETTTRQANANETIIGILNRVPVSDFIERFIRGTEAIDLRAALAPYGIEVQQTGAGTRLSIGHANAAQKKLLKCLSH